MSISKEKNDWKIEKKVFTIIGLLIIIILFISSCNSKDEVCIKEKCFEVEKVSTPKDMQQGLMFREQLEENKGMLFIFKEEDIHSFWMKNTLIPLDMIWINSNNEVVHIYKNAIPCTTEICNSITPTADALYVLEINAGLSDKYNFNVGDKVKIN